LAKGVAVLAAWALLDASVAGQCASATLDIEQLEVAGVVFARKVDAMEMWWLVFLAPG